MSMAMVPRSDQTVAAPPQINAETMEKVLLQGNLSALTPPERLNYYRAVCESVGLNPLTRPFDYINLNNKLTLYAKRECTDQLRTIHNVSVTIKSREVTEGCFVVTAHAQMPNGRQDESIGVLPIEGLKGENRSNAMMKAETKAKRRVTLSICGLSFLDESEVASVQGATHVKVDPETGEVIGGTKEAAAKLAATKLAEMSQGKSYAEASAAVAGTVAKVVADEPPSEVEQQLRESIVQAEANTSRRTKRQPSRFDILQAFGQLKKRYKNIGHEKTYYSVLGRHGYEHSNAFPETEEGLSLARSVYKEMSLNVADLEAFEARAEAAARPVV